MHTRRIQPTSAINTPLFPCANPHSDFMYNLMCPHVPTSAVACPRLAHVVRSRILRRSCVYLEGIGAHRRCTRSVLEVWSVYIHLICSWSVFGVYLECSWSAFCTCSACICSVFGVHSECMWSVFGGVFGVYLACTCSVFGVPLRVFGVSSIRRKCMGMHRDT